METGPFWTLFMIELIFIPCTNCQEACSVPDVDDGSKDSRATIVYNTTVTYTCAVGHIHTYGNLIRKCQANGQLDGTSPTCTRGSSLIRLINGFTQLEGRVEVLHNGTWGTVCGDVIDIQFAKVVCRQLEYATDNVTVRSSSYFGAGSGQIWLDDVTCQGNETAIDYCMSSPWGQHKCGHNEDVGVTCSSHAIRLRNGKTQYEGRVEVLHKGTWGTICDDGININFAKVVCRMLGYDTDNVAELAGIHFGAGNGPIWLDDVVCQGNEISIDLCIFRPWGQHNCGHHEDVGVICKACSVPVVNYAFKDSWAKISYNTTVTYTCLVGHIHTNGDLVRTCQADGQLDGISPTCTRVPDIFCEEDVDDEGRIWNYTEGGTQLKQECKPGYTGSITRYCQKDGVFRLPYYNCTWAVLKDLSEQLANGTVTGAEALANLTASVMDGNRTLYIRDLLQTQNILEAVVSENSKFTNDSIYDFLETASFLIDDEANGEQWQSSIQNTNKGAESLLSVVDDFAVRLSDSLASSTITQVTVTKPNIVLTYSSVADTDENSPPLQFPSSESRNSPGDEWQSEPHSYVNINLKALKGGNVSTFVGLVYKNLSQAVPTKLEGQEEITISSQVLSLHLLPHAPVKLDPEIQLNFERFEETNGTRFNDFCAFWNTTAEKWSTSGCHVVSSNGSQVQCACNHLTNFALLMSPYKSTNEVLQKISMVITYIGCGLSILALIVTIALHAFYWKILRSERESLTMCLCVVLVLANILFLAGIGQTENQTVCRWIAVSLHVVFLTVFFTMLSFGLYVYFAVAVVFKSGKYKLVVLFLVAFVPPIAVVLTAASISKLEGYGTKASCWLDVDHWMFWTFAGPAAFVILVNGIIILIVLVKMFSTQAAKNKDALDRIKMTITALSVLLPLMGLGWVFGLFAVNKKTQWFQIVFCFFNALQGVFIFIFHCLLNKQLKRAIQLSRERKRTLDEFNDEQKKRMATGTQDSSSDNTKGTYTSETGTIEQSEARERTTSVKLEDVRLELKERMAELFTADGEVISGRQLLHKHKGSTEGVHTDKGLSLHKDSSKIHNEPSKYHSNSEETTFSNDCNPFIPTENTIEKESLELSTKVDRYVTNGDDSNRFVKDCDSISHISQLKDSNKSDVLEILNNTNNDDLHHDTSIEGHSQLDASDDEELKSDNLNGNHTAKEKLRTIDAKEAVDQTIESENLYDNVKTRIFTDGTFDAIEDEKKEKAFDQNESNETALHRIL